MDIALAVTVVVVVEMEKGGGGCGWCEREMSQPPNRPCVPYRACPSYSGLRTPPRLFYPGRFGFLFHLCFGRPDMLRTLCYALLIDWTLTIVLEKTYWRTYPMNYLITEMISDPAYKDV